MVGVPVGLLARAVPAGMTASASTAAMRRRFLTPHPIRRGGALRIPGTGVATVDYRSPAAGTRIAATAELSTTHSPAAIRQESEPLSGRGETHIIQPIS